MRPLEDYCFGWLRPDNLAYFTEDVPVAEAAAELNMDRSVWVHKRSQLSDVPAIDFKSGKLIVGRVTGLRATTKRRRGWEDTTHEWTVRYTDGSTCTLDSTRLAALAADGEDAQSLLISGNQEGTAADLQVVLENSVLKIDDEIMSQAEREREFGGAVIALHAHLTVGPLRVPLEVRVENDARERPFRCVSIRECTGLGALGDRLTFNLHVETLAELNRPWKACPAGISTGPPDPRMLERLMELAGLSGCWPQTMATSDRVELERIDAKGEEHALFDDEIESSIRLTAQRVEGLFVEMYHAIITAILAKHGETAANGVPLGVAPDDAADQFEQGGEEEAVAAEA